MEAVPGFRLSLGQLVWTLNRGRPAGARLRNEVRYLRQLGIPHAESEAGVGRGHPIYYNFDELIEVGVALSAIRRGMSPKDAAKALTEKRKDYRQMFRNAWLQLPEEAINQEWVKSRGRVGAVLANELFLRLHDRYSAEPGTYELTDSGRLHPDAFGMTEVFPDQETRALLPLTKLVLELVAWAREAPAVRAGRPS